MSNHMEIAKTIQSQIGTRTMMTLGATKLTALPTKDGEYDGGLAFKASLFGKFGCIVIVTLNARDTYDIKVVTERGRKLIDSCSDVYADELSGNVEIGVERWFASKRQAYA